MTVKEYIELSAVVRGTKTVVINGVKAGRIDRERLLYDVANEYVAVNGFVVGGIACIETI